MVDTIVDQERQERGGHVLCVQPLDHIVPPDLDIDEVAKLRFISGEQLVEGSELPWIAGGRADPLPGARVDPVVQGDLEDLGHVEVAGEDVGLLPVGAGLDAPA